MLAPTVDELLKNNLVQEALEQAWLDSLSDDPTRRHEEGGWVYANLLTGEVLIQRAPAGAASAMDLNHPPTIAACAVVATFHTHPHPSAEGWLAEPSAGDIRLAMAQGVPCFIRAEDGIHVTGPETRRGGMVGGPGFPP